MTIFADTAFLRSSWTNRLISAKDHGSIQINIGHLDQNGVYTGQYSTFALSGQVRSRVRRFPYSFCLIGGKQ